MQTQILLSESYERYTDKLERNSHSVGISMWDFEWCPKYRYKMFRKWKYKKLIEACIRKKEFQLKSFLRNAQMQERDILKGIFGAEENMQFQLDLFQLKL